MQRLESRGRLENEGTKRTITQQEVLSIFQKVPETVIHLKVDEDKWKATKRSKRKADGQRKHLI